jgi:2-C-methyl-D-erythritol 4-phosphate cytidylyltransferase
MIKNIGIILAGGIGSRYGSTIPKQYAKLNGVPVIQYVLNEFIKSKEFDRIVIVMNDLRYKYLLNNYSVDIIKGGNIRNESVAIALEYCKKYHPTNILFHDAVRPLIKANDFHQYIEALKINKGVITVEKIIDSLYPVHNRDFYKLVQTPEAFNYDYLKFYFDKKKEYSAIYQHLIARDMKLIELNHPNYKITYPYDLFMLEHLVKYTTYVEKTPGYLGNRNILLLGGMGGIGSEVYKLLIKYRANIFAPSHEQLDISQENFIPYPYASDYCNIDIIINCAGISYKDNEGILKHYNEIMNVNLKANLQLIEYSKKMREVYHDKPINIVTISSSSATKGRHGLTVYSASKVALNSIIESQAEELSEKEIYLNCICPEKVDTSLARNLHGKLNQLDLIHPTTVAKAILSYVNTKDYGKIIYFKKEF